MYASAPTYQSLHRLQRSPSLYKGGKVVKIAAPLFARRAVFFVVNCDLLFVCAEGDNLAGVHIELHGTGAVTLGIPHSEHIALLANIR